MPTSFVHYWHAWQRSLHGRSPTPIKPRPRFRAAPDGRMIAFDSDRHGERAVFVANRDGSDIRRVSGTGYAAVPTWSPDGHSLAYVRAEPGRPAVRNLWITRDGDRR